ncbi:MAG: DUF3307 domain-containing protein [Clostridiales bacterium]|nr:DUF3307 domain-containing protein [Clostridiales bacterium]
MEIIKIILGLITAHVFGDYVFQSAYIAENKKRNVYHLLVHCWIYTACFWCALYLLNRLNLWIVGFVFISHVILDYLKSRIEEKIGAKAYAIDQILHYVIISIVIFLVK